MIKKIATNVSNELNSTPSKDFDNFVGIEAHLAKMDSLLCLETNEVRMMGIWGPAGIGKSTIARALYNRLSSNFQLTLFMDNVKGSYRSNESYCSKLRLLSELFNDKDSRIKNLGVAEKRLTYRKVLIVLDDVDKIEQLNALADRSQWFGNGSRIIVTTEHKNILETHDINHIYEVGFPSRLEAMQIFSQSAFRQDSPPDGYVELANEVAKLTVLPLGLSVLGSSLRGKSKSKWIRALPSLKATLDEDIERILRVGYDSLGDNDNLKAIFLHIACLFNGERKDRLTQLLEKSDLDIESGLDVLVERALISISSDKRIMMHHLLQQMGQQIVRRESTHEPGKRQFLISKLRALHFDDCRELESLPELPDSMEELSANNCVSLERISDSSKSSHTPKLILSFLNCSKLDQEARKLLIEQWTCGYAILPGCQVPNYFTHQARGSSLTIHLDPMRFYGSLRFKACVVLPRDELTKFGCDIIQIWCSIRGTESFMYEWPRIHSDHDPLVDHLVIFNSYHTLEEGMIYDNKVVFNFRCYPAMIEQCGIKLLEPCSCEHNIMGHPRLLIRPLNGWISLLYRRTFMDYGTDSSGECVDSDDADTDDGTEDSGDSGDRDGGKDNGTDESGDGDADTDNGTEDNEESGVRNLGKGYGIEDNEELGVSDLETRRSKKRKRSSSGEKQERPSKKMRRM